MRQATRLEQSQEGDDAYAQQHVLSMSTGARVLRKSALLRKKVTKRAR
jgi:hypothetical protein